MFLKMCDLYALLYSIKNAYLIDANHCQHEFLKNVQGNNVPYTYEFVPNM